MNWFDGDQTHRKVMADDMFGCNAQSLFNSRRTYRKSKKKKIDQRKRKPPNKKKKKKKSIDWVCGIGDVVMARWQGDQNFYPATITGFV